MIHMQCRHCCRWGSYDDDSPNVESGACPRCADNATVGTIGWAIVLLLACSAVVGGYWLTMPHQQIEIRTTSPASSVGCVCACTEAP